MGLRIGPNPTSWQSFQLTSPSLLCYAPKAAEKISSSLLKVCSGSNNSFAYGLTYQPARSRSCYSRGNGVKRACRGNSDELSDEELSKQMLNLLDYDEEIDNKTACTVSEISGKAKHIEGEDNVKLGHIAALQLDSLEPSLLDIQPEPPHWPERDEVLRIGIERRANRLEIPISLRIIKRKQQWEESLKEAGDFTYCSVKRAFSSMVFIIRELQSYALHIRESLNCEDLHGIVDNVRRELNASFVWLFQQVFSRTPTLMVYVMILLANFTVCSMADNIVTAATATSPEVSCGTITETENKNRPQFKFDAMAIRSFSNSSSTLGNSGGGGGGKVSPVASGTEGGDKNLRRSSLSMYYPDVVPDEISKISLFRNTELITEEEVNLWSSVVEEASRMQAEMRGEALDHETRQHLVSPVTVELESDDYEDYFRTDLLYQTGLNQESNNTLLLSNYAQFLYLVAHDNDRAEECFKRAVLVDPMDAEGLGRYADFLWKARKDMWGAEERYEQAMAAEPGNPYHASKYANFLWSTGGEETCYPLNTSYDVYNKVM